MDSKVVYNTRVVDVALVWGQPLVIVTLGCGYFPRLSVHPSPRTAQTCTSSARVCVRKKEALKHMHTFRLLIVLIFATRSRLLKLFCVALETLETPKQPPRLKADLGVALNFPLHPPLSPCLSHFPPFSTL